jgi:peroxiredoxin
MSPSDNLYEGPRAYRHRSTTGRATTRRGCRYLSPFVSQRSTSGELVDLSTLAGTTTVVYCYPLTGRPYRGLPEGWDETPGAHGCSTQSCAFRDYHHAELQAPGVRVFGLSTQDTGYQRAAAGRLQLPFALLNDEKLECAGAVNLPTFEAEGRIFIRCLTPVDRGWQHGGRLLPRLPARQERRGDTRMALRTHRELERT